MIKCIIEPTYVTTVIIDAAICISIFLQHIHQTNKQKDNFANDYNVILQGYVSCVHIFALLEISMRQQWHHDTKYVKKMTYQHFEPSLSHSTSLH